MSHAGEPGIWICKTAGHYWNASLTAGPEVFYEERSPYEPDDEGPEAKAYRKQVAQQERDEREIEGLLHSLTTADAHVPLFSYGECRAWNLRRKRRQG